MAALTEAIGGATPDELLRLTGTTNGTFFESMISITTTTTAAGVGGGGTGFNLGATGAGKLMQVHAVFNVVNATTAAIAIAKMQDSADGTTWADIPGAAFSTFTPSNSTMVGSTTTNALSQTAPQRVAFRVAAGRPFIRAFKSVLAATGTGTFSFALIVDPVYTAGV
jgi:hypothetical protein